MSLSGVETTRARAKSNQRNKPNISKNQSLSPSRMKVSRVSVPRIMAMGALLFIAFAVLVYCVNIESQTSQLRATVYDTHSKSSTGEVVTPPLSPRGAVIEGTEVFFMMPTTQAKGVLIFFHGCNHAGGQDMFELPEDRIVALEALKRGLAVMAPTSINRKTGCWGHQDGEDFKKNRVVDKWMESVGLSPALPRMGMGASSGGSFLFSVYKTIGLSSMASYVSGRGFTESELAAGNLPPIIYVYMVKDWRTADKVEEKYSALKKAGVATEKIQVYPHAFTTELCSQRLPELGDRRCRAFLRDVLEQGKLVGKQDGTVLASYQDGEWTAVMEKNNLDAGFTKTPTRTKKGTLSTKSFGGHSWLWASMEEEIAASFGVHEMTSQSRDVVLDFLMKYAGIETTSSTNQ